MVVEVKRKEASKTQNVCSRYQYKVKTVCNSVGEARRDNEIWRYECIWTTGQRSSYNASGDSQNTFEDMDGPRVGKTSRVGVSML